MTQLWSGTVSVTTTSLLMFSNPGNSQYRLDNVRLAGTSLSNTTVYSYNAANELTKMTTGPTGNGTDINYYYDAWGRTISKDMQSGAHTATYGYRYGDKLKWSTTNFPDEQPKSYNYDGFGRRRNAMVTGTPPMTWWRYDAGWNMIAEYTDPNADWEIENQTSTFVPGLAEIMGADPATGAYRYYYGDNLGSNRRMRNQSKASLANYEYDPYGSLYNGAGLPLKRGFTGHTWDNDTKMYFAPYRYYMPSAARWLTRDPMGYVDGPNLYGYVGGNPATFYDPYGDSAAVECLQYWPAIPPAIAAIGTVAVTVGGVLTAPVSVPTIMIGIGAGVVVGAGAGYFMSKKKEKRNSKMKDTSQPTTPPYPDGPPPESGHNKKGPPKRGPKWDKHSKRRPGTEYNDLFWFPVPSPAPPPQVSCTGSDD